MRNYVNGFMLLVLFVVGRIPIHRLRLTVYRLVGIQIGAQTSIHWRAVFFGARKITIGHNTIIGNDCFLDGRAGLSIGDNVNISGHVQIFTFEHDPQSPDFGTKGGPVRIEDYAYVATRAMIMPGITVGRGAVVAANAVVTKDVPEYTIVGGVPARQIGERTRDLRYQLNFHMPFQ